LDSGIVEWGGVRFLALHHHDGHFFRQPGLFGLVQRMGDQRALLYIGHTDNIALGCKPHGIWEDALRLGMNELHVALHVVERIDRLVLCGHIVKRCEPLLNLIGETAPALETAALKCVGTG